MEIIIGKNYPKFVIPKIDEAKHDIEIIVFDWRWYENDPTNPVQLFNQSIVRAVRRGVKVSACVNFPYSNDILSELGIDVCEYKHRGTLHSKIILIDNKDLILGSHNFTQSAFTSNIEVSLYIKDFDSIDKIKELIENIKK